MTDFTPVTTSQVAVLIRFISGKSSPLDYVSTSIDYKIMPGHICLTHCQSLFLSEKISLLFRVSQVTPLLKKSDFDPRKRDREQRQSGERGGIASDRERERERDTVGL